MLFPQKQMTEVELMINLLCCKILIHRNFMAIYGKWTIGCKDAYAGYNAKLNKSKQCSGTYFSFPSHSTNPYQQINDLNKCCERKEKKETINFNLKIKILEWI